MEGIERMHRLEADHETFLSASSALCAVIRPRASGRGYCTLGSLAFSSLAFACLALVTGCDRGDAGLQGGSPSAGPRSERTGRPMVATTFYPTWFFAARLAGELADVVCALPDEADPATWQPDAASIARLQEADLIVINGADFEQWVARVTLPEARVVDTARAFQPEWLRYEEAVTHRHGPAGEHTHEGIDGHTWLDPLLAQQQTEAILHALVRLLPEHEAALRRRYEALAGELRALDARLRELSRGASESPLFVYASHPAYNYLARRHGWRMQNLDLDPEEMPSEEAFDTLRARLAAAPGRYLLWESAPMPALAERLREELGLTSLVFSPLETQSEEAAAAGDDYLTIYRRQLEALAPVLSAGG